MRAPKLVIVVGLAVIGVAVVLAGLRSERHLQGTNHLRTLVQAVPIAPGQTACQAGETVPAGTGGVRVQALAESPAFSVSVDGALRGSHAAGWAQGDVVVDLPETTATRRNVTVCVTNAGPGALALGGEAFAAPDAAQIDGTPQIGRARLDYVQARAESWWQLAPDVAKRIAGARAGLPGGGTPYVWVLLALGAIALATRWWRLRPAGAVALVATLNALAWGMIVPPFQVPDEPSHFYYAQYLGETGKLPAPGPAADVYSGDIEQALAATSFAYVAGQPLGRPNWDVDIAAPDRDRTGAGNAATASTNPPLYYVAQAAVYRASRGLGVFDRLVLMQLLSALLAGLTVLCVFVFLRELLPGSPLAWAAGALLVALMPMFGFLSAGVNNDGGLYLASAALFLLLARVLRRGLTSGRAAACGAVLGTGVLVKTQMLAFAPAVALALALAAGPKARAFAAAGAAAALPLALYGVLGATVWRRPVLDRVDVLQATSPRSGTLPDQLSYLWQEYLPKLPLMSDLVPGVQPWSLWFKGLVGRFGWLDYGFPGWAYAVALVIVAATAAAAARFGWRARRGRGRELAVFALAAAGLMLAVATVSYHAAPPFDQGRYLLPLLPLFALVPALAVRGAGPRRGPVVAASLVIAVVGFSVFAQLLTIARYYG
ncbi:DUF2142 domain-containing protein [Solirubrobacter ginsenosidimutans]|uniref:DUF2142 domain-containing protein n=1 Tax=Solirubrobacter ginsenosidimutans TaxID=490573 RepID=A0A9X3MY71_9ACTN|nr:DUF2142 domain-containing protein [Solirubrobacter ginsenosidimutans]MDA0164727.1 DUF2142 domain-containing protein [Solirubrobacter ginsenosidimutans]